MSFRAWTSVFLGIRTIRSVGPHPLPEGRLPLASAVMSAPMTAKSPPSSSNMSGQELPVAQLNGDALEDGPNFRMNIASVFLICPQAPLSAFSKRLRRAGRARSDSPK